jgi:HAD domain in Swiss Army Knife RNA repair proteins
MRKRATVICILFLDIDGCLNDHTMDPIAESTTILPRCVACLNRIIDATDCRIVIVSAWRYMILKGAMTLQGFEYLLQTHGVHAKGRLIGTTRLDWEPDAYRSKERGRQVREWLWQHAPADTYPHVALDDLDLGYTDLGIPFVLVDGMFGLCDADAREAIAILCPDANEDTAEFVPPSKGA